MTPDEKMAARLNGTTKVTVYEPPPVEIVVDHDTAESRARTKLQRHFAFADLNARAEAALAAEIAAEESAKAEAKAKAEADALAKAEADAKAAAKAKAESDAKKSGSDKK
jgi:hypothetical protein